MTMTSLTDEYLTVKEAQAYLALNGIDYHPVYVRTLVGFGRIRSVKLFNARLVERASLNAFIADRRRRRR